MILEALPFVVMWGVWRRINRLVFDRVDLVWEDVCDHIKLNDVCWLKAKDSSFPFFQFISSFLGWKLLLVGLWRVEVILVEQQR